KRWNEADARADGGGGAVLMVKLPFTFGDAAGGDAGVEAMWVDVTRVTGSEIAGTLANRPVYVAGAGAGLKLGDAVRGQREELLDYLLTRAGGLAGTDFTEGGESMRIL